MGGNGAFEIRTVLSIMMCNKVSGESLRVDIHQNRCVRQKTRLTRERERAFSQDIVFARSTNGTEENKTRNDRTNSMDRQGNRHQDLPFGEKG